MKKILSVFCIATLLFASCSDEYDDSKLWQNVNDLKDRIASLEKKVQTMNSDISSIQSIVDAINARDYIVKVEELADKSGYTITFAKGNTVTIKHGTNGINGTNGKSAYELAVSKGYRGTLDEWLESLNGTNGSNGKSAYELAVENGYTGTEQEWLESLKGIDGKDSPIIGIDIYEGVYYWTITTNGNKIWLLDNDGNKLKVSGDNGITPIIGIDTDGYWTIDMGNGVQRLKDANGEDVKAIGQDGTDGKDGVDGSSFFNNVRYDDNFVYFTFTDGKVVSIPLSKGVSFTVSNVSDRQLFVYGETRTFDIVQNNIAKISISKPDGWKVSVLGDVMTVIAPPQENNFAEESGEIAITAMGTDSKSFVMFSFSVKVFPDNVIPFTDSHFENFCVLNFDINKNGYIDVPSEIWDVKDINCTNQGIIDFNTNIRMFSNVETIDCSYNNLITWNIWGTSLNKVNCNHNAITELTINDTPHLLELDCSYNQLALLDMKKDSPKLSRLNCDGNKLSLLKIDNNQNLSYLTCGGNKLTTLNPNSENLDTLFCHSNQLKSLDLTNCPNVTILSCEWNQLTNLDLNKNEKLIGLVCHSNQLKSLDVSFCPNLKILNCSGNPDLSILYLKEGQQIENLKKDDHTQIVYK